MCLHLINISKRLRPELCICEGEGVEVGERNEMRSKKEKGV